VLVLAQAIFVGGYAQNLDADGPLAEITVTARRLAEPNWPVPLAVTTVTAAEIESAGIRNIEDLTHSVPGLAYSYARGQGGVPVLRGTSALITGQNQNNVATVVDGLYVSNPFAIDASMLDLEEIEVLRGPQNALVGRNAFAGAILYQSAQPTATLNLGAQVAAGSDRFSRESAFVSGPLADSLGGRMAAMHETFDGSIRNSADPHHNLGGEDKAALTGTLLWQPNDGTRVELSAQWYEDDRDATSRFGFGDVPPLLNCGLDASSGTYINYCGEVPAPAAVDISPDARGLSRRTVVSRLELEQRWTSVTVTSLTGFIRTRLNNPPDDWDLSSAGELIPVALRSAPDVVTRLQRANVYYTGFAFDDDEWSEELRVSGGTAAWQWLAGAYWANNSSFTHVGFSADARGLGADEIFISPWPSTLTPLVVVPFGDISGRNQIRSAFATLSHALSSSFKVSADLRWNSERIFSQTTFHGESPDDALSDRWSFLTPRLTLEYKSRLRNFIAYASAAEGARSGGFNDSTIPAETRYDAETNWTLELGVRTGSAEGRTYATAALYWMDWSDMQLTGSSLDPKFPFPVTRNVDGVTVTGVELSVNAHPVAWIDLALRYAYADARFKPDTIDLGIANTCTPDICRLIAAPPSGMLVPDVGGNQLPGAPRQSAAFNVTFHASLASSLGWYLRLGYYAAGREFTNTDNLNWLRSQRLPSARMGVLGRNWEFALWGRDLTGTLRNGFATAVSVSPFSVSPFVGDRANGSNWGASLLYHLP
jgi:iron complex outermembrane receptor protein